MYRFAHFQTLISVTDLGGRGVCKGRMHPLNFEQQNFFIFLQFLLITNWAKNN